MSPREASYLGLYRSGELARLAAELENRLAACHLCPRKCGVNRLAGETGFCRAAYLPLVSSACAHQGEEPAISGSRGSGTIFFGHCNLACVYCQNYQISQPGAGAPAPALSIDELAARMLYLQNDLGCHNINLVSPSSWAPQIVRAVLVAASRGLNIPLVYNSNGYDSVETLQQLNGIVDIYLPDLRYGEDKWAARFSGVKDYVGQARAAIREMYRQVGNLQTDEDGVAERGLIVRHLILISAAARHRLSGWPQSFPHGSP
jgi:putative pyruvate formate lyase activating enzyme